MVGGGEVLTASVVPTSVLSVPRNTHNLQFSPSRMPAPSEEERGGERACEVTAGGRGWPRGGVALFRPPGVEVGEEQRLRCWGRGEETWAASVSRSSYGNFSQTDEGLTGEG